jgi:hypothetical protein
VHARRDAELARQRLERLPARAVAGDDEPRVRQRRRQARERGEQDLERLLGPQHGDGRDHRRAGSDPELLPHVHGLARRARHVRVGQQHDLLGGHALELDHALAVALRHGHEDVGEPRDDLAVEEPPQRLALVRPRVLVRDDDRHAGQPPEHRSPQVRAEEVRVQDVDLLVAQKAHEPGEGGRVEAPPAVEREMRDPLGGDGRQERPARRPRGRDDHVEAVARQVGGDGHRGPLGAAGTPQLVEQHEHTDDAVTSGPFGLLPALHLRSPRARVRSRRAPPRRGGWSPRCSPRSRSWWSC